MILYAIKYKWGGQKQQFYIGDDLNKMLADSFFDPFVEKENIYLIFTKNKKFSMGYFTCANLEDF